MSRKYSGNRRSGLVGAWMILGLTISAWGEEPARIVPGKLPRVGSVDERFQSYNVEMVEVTGGRFWAPYRKGGEAAAEKPRAAAAPAGLDPSLFQMRKPSDLGNARLRRLAPAMGGAPKGYDAAAYGRDFQIFRAFAREYAPGMLILGPGSVGEAGLASGLSVIKSEEMLAASGRGVDAF